MAVLDDQQMDVMDVVGCLDLKPAVAVGRGRATHLRLPVLVLVVALQMDGGAGDRHPASAVGGIARLGLDGGRDARARVEAE